MAIKRIDEMSRDELLELVQEMKTKNKYGLVWEEKVEDVAEQCRNYLPILTEIRDREIISDKTKPINLLVEGDNFHALSVLNFTHEKAIDVIYVDPPFNTGSRSWKYNNDYVDKDDSYKHSKFISFLYKRFQLAKKLLTENGIFICAIDDYEVHNVRHILDEIFGERNRLGSIVVVHNPRGRNDDKFFATMHEYMLIYARDASKATIGHFELTQDDKDKYNKRDVISDFNETSFIRTGNNSRRTERPNLYYPIYYNSELNTLDLEPSPNSVELLPINGKGEERTWRWDRKTFFEKKDTELLVRKVHDQFRIFKKRRITNIIGTKPKTVWSDSKYDASSNGIMLLQDMFNGVNPFPYPKSLHTVKDILFLTTTSKSVILDFFAGSGTTGHAVFELNQADNGSRQFILCTDNENNIAEHICYERIKKVINGYVSSKSKNVKGLGGNLKYFSTSFIPSLPTDDNKKRITANSIDLICIKENSFERVQENEYWSIFRNSDYYTAIVFETNEISSLKATLRSFNHSVHIYIFSLSNDTYDEEFEDLNFPVTLCPIPESILKVYRRIFK